MGEEEEEGGAPVYEAVCVDEIFTNVDCWSFIIIHNVHHHSITQSRKMLI